MKIKVEIIQAETNFETLHLKESLIFNISSSFLIVLTNKYSLQCQLLQGSEIDKVCEIGMKIGTHDVSHTDGRRQIGSYLFCSFDDLIE